MALIKCPECGKEISDKAAACPNCGVPILMEQKSSYTEKKPDKQDYSARYRQTDQRKMRAPEKPKEAQTASIRCPHCGGHNLQAISDVEGKGASFWKLCFCGLPGLCGAGKTTTTHYWVCKDCGYKFKM